MRTVSTIAGWLVMVHLLLSSGCDKRDPRDDVEKPPLEEIEYDSMMLVGLDMSGSFDGHIDKSFICMLKAMDGFFRSGLSTGKSSRVTLFQLSGKPRPLIWDGPPTALRQTVGSSQAFKELLAAHSHPAGSRVYAGISDSLEFLMSTKGVRDGRTRVTLLVFSDMDDNFPDREKSKQRLLTLLTEFSKTKHSLGMYFVNQSEVTTWRLDLQKCGIKNFVVEPDFVAQPTLPVFPD